MSQGQSSITPGKEEAFAGVFYINLAVSLSPKNRGYGYTHVDLNAGSGYNDKAGCNGSPLVFLDAALRAGRAKFLAYFVDRDRQAVAQLLGRIGDDPRCIIHHGDNREFVTAIPRLISLNENPRFALGMVLCDPNGVDIPLDELEWLSMQCPRLDFCINYSSTTAKRVRAASRAVPEKQFKAADLFLLDLLKRLHKQHWHVQAPLPSDPQEWMILLGRNGFDGGDWKAKRFHPLNLDQPDKTPVGWELVKRSLSRRESTESLF